MTFPLALPEPLRGTLRPGTRVLLGLSGGLDSTMALAVLRAAGCRVLGVTFRNFPPAGQAADQAADVQEAAELARALGAEHFIHDLAPRFLQEVISPFVAEYLASRTPNPCVECNARVRFPALAELADAHGCALVATGHYARIEPGQGGGPVLKRGVDREKDQSYFLHRIAPDLFHRLVFPLGWYRKSQIRQAAADLGLSVAGKAESQEVCFLPADDRSHLFPPDGRAAVAPGDIVDRGGRILGRHRGLVHYTVGQRRGLGVAAPQPLYVLELQAGVGRLLVGAREELARSWIAADGFQAAVSDFPDACREARGVVARIRHRHRGSAVASWNRRGDQLEVTLSEPASGVAPGQSLVLYRGDVVLGGGRIVGAAASGGR